MCVKILRGLLVWLRCFHGKSLRYDHLVISAAIQSLLERRKQVAEREQAGEDEAQMQSGPGRGRDLAGGWSWGCLRWTVGTAPAGADAAAGDGAPPRSGSAAYSQPASLDAGAANHGGEDRR